MIKNLYIKHIALIASLLLAFVPSVAFTSPAAANDADAKELTVRTVEKTLHHAERNHAAAFLKPKIDHLIPGEHDMGEGHVVVPDNLSNGVHIIDSTGEKLMLTPKLHDSEKVHGVFRGGLATYLDGRSAQTIIVGDIGVQILTTIASEDSPRTYEYETHLESGETIELINGGAAIIGSDGTVKTYIPAPWAVDAKGLEVPTWFEIDGSSLVQVIDHANEDISYPVVADPIVIAPWVYKCLVGLGLKGPEITRIAQLGTPGSILAAFGRAAVACIFMK